MQRAGMDNLVVVEAAFGACAAESICDMVGQFQDTITCIRFPCTAACVHDMHPTYCSGMDLEDRPVYAAGLAYSQA